MRVKFEQPKNSSLEATHLSYKGKQKVNDSLKDQQISHKDLQQNQISLVCLNSISKPKPSVECS